MSVVVVGLNHRTVPLDVLERMTVDGKQLPKALHDLRSRPHLSEAVVLSTCNRTEIYAVAEKYHGAIDDIRSFLTDVSGLNIDAFADHLYAYHDEVAVGHLFKVAAGLDSAVVGESEILGQVRAALEAARDEDAASAELTRLFTAALAAGRRARVQTGISRGTTSVSQAAVEMAADRLGTLDGRRILVLGAGEIGAGMAAALAGVRGLAETVVANRTRQRAVELARRIGGRVVDLGELASALVEVDVLLASTGAPMAVITADDVAAVMEARDHRPLLIVDVAVPRDVDAAAGQIDGVTLLDMDDLRAFADSSLAERRREIPRVQRILGNEVERFHEQLAARQVAPLIVELRDRAEEIRVAEVERIANRIGSIDDATREHIDAVTRSIVNKLLHEPTVRLKAEAATARGERLADAIRQLFDL